MTAVSPPTPFTPRHLRERVQEMLAADALPPIVQAGHPVLRQPAAAFDGQIPAAELDQLIALMRRVMHEAPGVGLAAPQIGIPLQLAVLEDRFDVDPDVAAVRHRTPLDFLAVLNPRYTPVGGETAAFFEGCLSLSGLQAVVVRHERVRLQFETPGGLGMEQEFEGWQARIVQHETDHLHGTLYIDRAELRSLSSNAEYAANWSEPGIGKARAALGFLPDAS
ncbi:MULTISPECIES: peptide deformylase [Pseudarthrobacter]|uniref:peptide deformylase n=1 Tax=Pseudarthrobacter TaxID=1742993 RepID=UPI0013DA4DB8|nr:MULTISPECIES: peptide deformylase [Pseudarthrobacter]MDP9996621.1 peptide deformylase [Pseudarthrobacter sulfonivorans]QOD05234.1 peptide deformylase [Pseudarthrobacter sp. BIM B-2242]